jgi:hypothetical protein
MVDPYTLLSMLAMLPLLEEIDALVNYAQMRDVFVCDFVGGLLQCQEQLFTLYKGVDTAYKRDRFYAFNQILDFNHEQILMKWERDLNCDSEQLAFVFGEHTLLAVHNGAPVTRESFADLVQSIKQDCSGKIPMP